MKYEAPTITRFGTIQEITQASLDSDRQDRIFNAAGNEEGTATGSLDQCFFNPNTNRCVNA